ncbi:phosphate/phosphite/phosphonate ABC transporter substrate-binding protein [Natronomonas amylolytica]|uniref:phosphate/phosphite/phosphonate ABC transporter substrate-binding protein n=1 Tax=Natronomonas amylolytica TaxID=3108498 RepID=UPI00300985BC
MNRRQYLSSLAGAATISAAGCLDGSDNDDSASSVDEWADGTIEFALPPFQDAEELQEQYADTFEWLAEGLEGVDDVQGVPTTSYSAAIESVVQGHTELANLSPIIYAMAADEGIHPLVINWSHGSDAYHSYIATRADTEIETLADLEGKTVAMVDPLSSSGGLFPRYMLNQAGLDVGDVDTEPSDLEIEWAGSHGASFETLDAGHVDAAAYGDFQHPDDDAIVKIAESEPIPFDPIVAKPGTPESVRETLTERLINTPEEALEDHRIDRFGEVKPGTYDPVRDVAETMGINIDDLEASADGDDE